MRCLPAREDVMRAQTGDVPASPRLRDVNPGQVLVIDARELSAGVLGDVLATRLVTRGGVAVVTDGAVRDLAAMQEVELAPFARGVHAAVQPGPYRLGLEHPYECAGVLIAPACPGGRSGARSPSPGGRGASGGSRPGAGTA